MNYNSAINFASKILKKNLIKTASIDSEIILSKTVNLTREQILLNLNKKLSFKELKYFKKLINRRKKKEPIAYILKKKEFWKQSFQINSNVLIPRPDTEILVEEVLKCLPLSSSKSILEIGTGSGALTLYLNLILDKKSQLFTLDENEKNQRRAQKTIERFVASSKINNLVDVNYINGKLSAFAFNDLSDKVDTIITDIPEPWEFFLKNQIKQNLNWVSYLPSISQVEKIVTKLRENNFVNLKITETLNREWIVDKKIVRPKNEMVGHTGFVVGARYLSS